MVCLSCTANGLIKITQILKNQNTFNTFWSVFGKVLSSSCCAPCIWEPLPRTFIHPVCRGRGRKLSWNLLALPRESRFLHCKFFNKEKPSLFCCLFVCLFVCKCDFLLIAVFLASEDDHSSCVLRSWQETLLEFASLASRVKFLHWKSFNKDKSPLFCRLFVSSSCWEPLPRAFIHPMCQVCGRKLSWNMLAQGEL